MPADDEGREEGDPWRARFCKSLKEGMGKDAVNMIVLPELSSFPENSWGNVHWTASVLRRMDKLILKEEREEVLMRCAHYLQESEIAPLRDFYAEGKDIPKLMEFWQERFIAGLKQKYNPMPKQWLATVQKQHWGPVGVYRRRSVQVTKLPTDLRAYFNAHSDGEKRCAYCHCARIKATFEKGGERISPTYCCCGAGFYKSNWERILGRPVKVKLQKSLLNGDEVCQFLIDVSED